MRRIISAVKRGNRLRLLALSVLAVVMLFGATGCWETIDGGGWMRSTDEQSKATFGIRYDAASEAGRGTYQDKAAGVSLRFYEAREEVRASDEERSDEEIFSDCAYFYADYQSLDKTNRGSGTAYLVACDTREYLFRGDTLHIELQTGPYAGYTNTGPILGGNLQGFDA